MQQQQEDNSGVSPVIGVILMVAVTVALVALVTVVVFDLGGDVSDSPDATVQLEEESNSVTATVLRNENVQDFTLQGTTQSGSTVTESLSGDPGSTKTISDVSTTAFISERFGADNGGSAINAGDSITLSNDAISKGNIDVDTTSGDGENFDTSNVGSNFNLDTSTNELTYNGGNGDPIYNINVIDYEYNTGTDPLTDVRVISNMPDGQSEVLTSTEVNN